MTVAIPKACGNCDVGFRRVDGVHLPSQRLGMIPETPCKRVGAAVDDEADFRRRFVACVDGEILRKKDGEPRRFATATAAANAARRAAPRMWHP